MWDRQHVLSMCRARAESSTGLSTSTLHAKAFKLDGSCGARHS